MCVCVCVEFYLPPVGNPGIFAAASNFLLKEVCAKFCIPCPSFQILGKTRGVKLSNFWISGQSLIKRKCHNSRTSDHTDMELGPVTKLDKRNKATSKNFKDDVMSENCDICHFSNLQSIWSNLKAGFRSL